MNEIESILIYSMLVSNTPSHMCHHEGVCVGGGGEGMLKTVRIGPGISTIRLFIAEN